NSSSFSLVYTGKNENQNLLYVFGYEQGFVIIAADDRIEPILGYAHEGRPFLVPGASDTITGNNFWGLMANYKKVIHYTIEKNLPGTAEITGKWQQLTNIGSGLMSPAVVVTPLLTTSWGQGWPYNSMCPVDASGPGGHVWAGCVATAMAQIMKFWSAPVTGLGSFSYQLVRDAKQHNNRECRYFKSFIPYRCQRDVKLGCR
ncbi:MAG: C10 family peptidase, partial [Bacteroidetes bacterium]|nr:C10 family peptidase [Bacteroidota bacterium]